MDKSKKEFSKIYDKFIERIYRFIFLKTNSKETAEDLTSETFLRAWEFFKNGNPKIENPSAFLYRIARNLVSDHYRERGRNRVISVDFETPIVDPRQNLEERAKIDLDLEIIKRELSKLDDDYQNAIIWYYLDGLPIREVANLLDKTEGATRVLISRAIKTLKKQLENKLA